MKVELFQASGCTRCAASREALKATALQFSPDVTWREVDVVEELDYAVELGVLTLPAVAIDRELVFASLPTPQQLTRAMRERSKPDNRHGP